MNFFINIECFNVFSRFVALSIILAKTAINVPWSVQTGKFVPEMENVKVRWRAGGLRAIVTCYALKEHNKGNVMP